MSLPPQMNIGCGTDIRKGWCNVDLYQMPGMEINRDYWFDMAGDRAKWPTPILTSKFSHFEASHIIEHIPNVLKFMENIWYLAEPGATLLIRCPHGGSDTAWQDQTHVRPMFEGSFQYYSQLTYWMQDVKYKGDWETEVVRLKTDGLNMEPVGNETMQDVNDRAYRMIKHGRNWVVEMEALLQAVKPARDRPTEPQKLELILELM